MTTHLQTRAKELGITVRETTINTLRNMAYKMHSDYEAQRGLNPDTFSMGIHHEDYLQALVEIDMDAYAGVIVSDLVHGGRSVGAHLAKLIYDAIRAVQMSAHVRLSHEGGLTS